MSAFTHGLKEVAVVVLAMVLLLAGLFVLPMIAILARFMFPVVFAAMVAVFIVSCFAPRLRDRIEHLGHWQPHT